MGIIGFLILFPFFAALIMSCMRKSGLIRRCVQFTLCGILVAAVIYFAVTSLILGETVSYLPHTHGIDMLMLVVEWGLVVLVFYYSFKFRKYYCALLSIVQTGLMTWLELTGRTEIPGNHIYADKLTIAMSPVSYTHLLQYYRQLLALRKSDSYKEAFTYGEFRPAFEDEKGIFAFTRSTPDRKSWLRQIMVPGNRYWSCLPG